MTFHSTVWVDCEFGKDLLGHVQDVRNDCVVVRLELEDNHPAMQDAVADGWEPEVAEFIAYVPFGDVRDQFGNPWKGA